MKKSTRKVLIAVLLIVVGVAFLIVKGISKTGVYYRTVAEVLDDASLPDKRGVRISGEVVGGTIDFDQQNLTLIFTVRDQERTDKAMSVIYEGVMPDAFEADIEVILEGRYDAARNTFTATTLLAKCPSKYESEEQEQKESL
jgi:cytochrome c-type biogenesis protein CcmE